MLSLKFLTSGSHKPTDHNTSPTMNKFVITNWENRKNKTEKKLQIYNFNKYVLLNNFGFFKKKKEKRKESNFDKHNLFMV